MQKTTPLQNPHSSTSDLLTWSEQPPPQFSRSGHCSRQPSDKIGEVLRGSQLRDEEAQSVAKKKLCSGYKMKEMTGSGIFSGNAENTTSEAKSGNSENRTSIRVYQQAMNRISQISFSTEGNVSPKIPTSLPEIAKQRELSGTYQNESETKTKKHISSAKTKELSGSDIFAPSPEILPRSRGAGCNLESKQSKDTREPVPRKVRASVQVSNAGGVQRNFLFGEEPVKNTSRKIHEQKFAELTGNNIFKGDVHAGSQEKTSSRAKLRELAGNNIFADGKAENRDHIRGARRPPGGGSSISLF
ncbi:uncharacterized protein HKW66_Vig0011640 [Vigna angularis]|uniref:DUF4057 domain-containing protein n=4 Tax=Phaseolus angularis TaxID=3914 RepID=A0A8T0LE45_PHAAN|nr:uncharacterized protein LOC108338452 [Vigna angularis]KAG2410499.1 uncharacterized protein HKW66_Vig0011640 [Vigna angularis]BAT73385.1 hypothetical protein VIGAN_01086300 [Vigna angularis var. angularis]